MGIRPHVDQLTEMRILQMVDEFGRLGLELSVHVDAIGHLWILTGGKLGAHVVAVHGKPGENRVGVLGRCVPRSPLTQGAL